MKTDHGTSNLQGKEIATRTSQHHLYRGIGRYCTAIVFSVALAIGNIGSLAQESAIVMEDVEGSYVSDVTSDSLGNVFVCGTEIVPEGYRPVVRKFQVGGQWETRILSEGSQLTAITARDVSVQGQQQSHVVTAGMHGLGETGGWVVHRSRDQGEWEKLAVFTNINSYYGPKGVSIGSDGSIYVVGATKVQTVSRKQTTVVYKWLVVRGIMGADGSLTWQTTYPPFDGQITGVACAQGYVYVAGYNDGYWQVGRSADQGANWQIVNQYRYDSTQPSGAYAMTVDGDGNLIVVGRAQSVIKGKTKNYGVIRKGTNQGTTWETLRVFDFGGSGYVWVAGVDVDVFGNIHVVGSAPYLGSTVRQWFSLKGSGYPLSSWDDTDQFRFAHDYWATGQRIAADAYGNVFAVGQARHPDGVDHNWIVRWTPAENP